MRWLRSLIRMKVETAKTQPKKTRMVSSRARRRARTSRAARGADRRGRSSMTWGWEHPCSTLGSDCTLRSMIRRQVGQEFWLITQDDHAQVSGQLAAQLGNDRFAA